MGERKIGELVDICLEDRSAAQMICVEGKHPGYDGGTCEGCAAHDHGRSMPLTESADGGYMMHHGECCCLPEYRKDGKHTHFKLIEGEEAAEMERVKGIRFCWLCSRKLRGNHQTIEKVEGHWRSLHKGCVLEAKGATHER